MARITTRELKTGYVVDIRGALAAADLRRLERACGPAIERRCALEIVFTDGTAMDAAACAYVERLRTHGAAITTRPRGRRSEDRPRT